MAVSAKRTEKQVIGDGYHRPVCVKCSCEMRPEQNGFGVLDFRENGEPYELWAADKWKCPKCGIEVVGGFGNGPVSAHYEADFSKHIAFYAKTGLVKNRGEVG